MKKILINTIKGDDLTRILQGVGMSMNLFTRSGTLIHYRSHKGYQIGGHEKEYMLEGIKKWGHSNNTPLIPID